MSPSVYRKLILGGLVAGLAGWLVIPRLLGTSGPRPAYATESVAPEAAEPVADNPALATPRVELAGWARDGPTPAAWPEDPFQRRRELASATEDAQLPARPEQPAAFVLSAIISGDVPRALINERVLAVGDRLADGSTVVAIETFSVALSGPEGTWTLELSE